MRVAVLRHGQARIITAGGLLGRELGRKLVEGSAGGEGILV